MTIIKTQVVKIGNSQGIRIPKRLLEQTGIVREVEIEVQDHCLVIRNIYQTRNGWEQSFALMSANHDDVLIDSDIGTDWEQQNWQW